EIIGVVGAIHDVSKRKQAESERKAVEGQYQTLVERLPAAVYVRDCLGIGKWDYVSPQIEVITGYPVAEWMKDPDLWFRLVHPEDRPEVTSGIALLAATGHPLNSEYRIRHKNGSEIWVRDEAVVVRQPATGGSELRGLFYDITQRKHLEEQLMQSQKVEAI